MILIGFGSGAALLLTGFGAHAIPMTFFAGLTAGALLTGMN